MGTVIAALAAIGGLIFTAIATYYSAATSQDQLRQSKDQLQQSREEASQAARAQALRVTYWYDQNDEFDRPSDAPMHLHLMNRSPDPVQALFLQFTLQDAGVDATREVNIVLTSLPPCSELVLNQEFLRVDLEKAFPWRKLTPGETLGVNWLSFTDRDSVRWTRSDGKLSRDDRFAADEDGEIEINGRVSHALPIKSVKVCGDV
ncbi:hypothetical protein [Streptomyces sp. R41]|uniref:Uncharacterized protein n=1 Tax=Streptomyces sp. R41 TaxID=3238632 RepID=A0AB39RHE9_9ACTN